MQYTDGWQEVRLEGSDAVNLGRERHGRGLALFWTEFDTNDPDQRRALMDFVARPLEALAGETEDKSLALEGVDREWRVVTTIPNHHHGLNPRITFAALVCVPSDKACYLTLTKQEE